MNQRVGRRLTVPVSHTQQHNDHTPNTPTPHSLSCIAGVSHTTAHDHTSNTPTPHSLSLLHHRSYMLRVLLGPILATSAFAAVVCYYNAAAAAGTALALPFGLAKACSFVPPAVISAAWEPYSLVRVYGVCICVCVCVCVCACARAKGGRGV